MAQKELGDINTLEIAIAEDETEIKYLKNILGDLEVLEILKPMLKIKKGFWEYLDVKHCFFDTQEQIDKVKEWLENETHGNNKYT